MIVRTALLAVLLGICAPFPAQAQAPAKTSAPAAAKAAPAKASVAPMPAGPAPASSHAPFEAGDCKVCHQNSDPKNPGPVTKAGTAQCLDCHDEYATVLKRPHVHAPARRDCTNCHNPHNARFPKLLKAGTRELCTGCHDEISDVVDKAKVAHKPVTTGAQCSSCHNPHASNVEKLLVKLPFDLCVGCHNRDDMADASGKKLQNLKAWLDGNKVWHGPVEKKDCSACHEPHGGDRFRLLTDDYPAAFYAPYDTRNYALCFSCHKEAAYSTAQTTTLTSFRNGSNNLHYLHLQQGGRGRTCRACHEVHASKQAHHIREGVPYGTSGWTLKLNFRKTETGGSCEKTCHQEKTYSNRAPR